MKKYIVISTEEFESNPVMSINRLVDIIKNDSRFNIIEMVCDNIPMADTCDYMDYHSGVIPTDNKLLARYTSTNNNVNIYVKKDANCIVDGMINILLIPRLRCEMVDVLHEDIYVLKSDTAFYNDDLKGENVEEYVQIKSRYSYIIKTGFSNDDFVDLLIEIYSNIGHYGILSKNIMEKLINQNVLLRNTSRKNIKSASYDLRIGNQYYMDGQIIELSKRKPFIEIKPYGYIIVMSEEIINMPNNIVGKFEISVGLFFKGVILSNGLQIDPGFEGPLFCLLFNSSNTPITMKLGDHYASIEFSKLVSVTEIYKGQYQNKGISEYLPSGVLKGGINVLLNEMNELKESNKFMQNILIGVISLIVSIISLVLIL